MLDSRKNKILKAIIEEYIITAEPVGSSTIVEKYDLDFSSATIRNDMADLEKEEYLEQPHKSAGRIPSKQGFRYYIDELIVPKELLKEEEQYIGLELESGIYDMEQLAKEITKVISETTNYTTIAIGPQITIQNIEEIKFVTLSSKLLMVIIITNTGNIKETIIKFQKDIRNDQIEFLNMIFNNKLKGEPIYNLKKTIEEYFVSGKDYMVNIIQPVINQINQVISQENNLYIKGFNKLLITPEFHDLEIVKNFIDILDDKEQIIDILNTDLGNKLNILIGEEQFDPKLKDFGIVTFKYMLGNKSIGTIGVIAPVRMDYSKVISVMGYINKHINDQFNKGLI